jgi:hypothetical protein
MPFLDTSGLLSSKRGTKNATICKNQLPFSYSIHKIKCPSLKQTESRLCTCRKNSDARLLKGEATETDSKIGMGSRRGYL